MLKGFHHAAISTPDIDRLVDFYCRHFACEVAWSFGWERGSGDADALTGLEGSAARATMLRLGDSYLELFEFSSPPPAPRHEERPVHAHGITHICIEVQDLHAEYARLSRAGMRFHCPPLAQDSGYVVYGRDPDGNVIELLEFTET